MFTVFLYFLQNNFGNQNCQNYFVKTTYFVLQCTAFYKPKKKEFGHLTERVFSSFSVSSLPLTDQNQCLKAAQDCGLYEKCGSLRSEYALACTKIIPGMNHCNRHKCHRALRRFLERVPEEYSFGVLFCPCSDTLCGERRRKTIVPSCSYEERDGQPNCLNLESYCLKDNLCRWDTPLLAVGRGKNIWFVNQSCFQIWFFKPISQTSSQNIYECLIH